MFADKAFELERALDPHPFGVTALDAPRLDAELDAFGDQVYVISGWRATARRAAMHLRVVEPFLKFDRGLCPPKPPDLC
jgi:hypothetical protein